MSENVTSTAVPTKEQIENLFINNQSFDFLSFKLRQSTDSRMLDMKPTQSLYSEGLAWYLDPRKEHGFGDKFTRAFLAEALKGHNFEIGPSAIDVFLSDMSDTQVHCEFEESTTLVVSQKNEWGFVIENNGDVGDNQRNALLKNYVSSARNSHPRLCIVGVSLSWSGNGSNHHVHMQYQRVCEIIECMIDFRGLLTVSDVRVAMTWRLHAMKEVANMGKSIDLEHYAKELYKSHKQALDYIFEHGQKKGAATFKGQSNTTNKREEFGNASRMVFGDKGFNAPTIQNIEGLNLYFNTIQYSKDVYRAFFLPESWADAMQKDEKEWPGSKWPGFFRQPLMADFCFYADRDKMTLLGQLYMEPGADRRKIVERIEQAAEQFSGAEMIEFDPRSHPDSMQSAFFQNNIYELKGKHDAESVAKVMKQAIREFKPAIDAIGRSLGRLDWSR